MTTVYQDIASTHISGVLELDCTTITPSTVTSHETNLEQPPTIIHTAFPPLPASGQCRLSAGLLLGMHANMSTVIQRLPTTPKSLRLLISPVPVPVPVSPVLGGSSRTASSGWAPFTGSAVSGAS